MGKRYEARNALGTHIAWDTNNHNETPCKHCAYVYQLRTRPKPQNWNESCDKEDSCPAWQLFQSS